MQELAFTLAEASDRMAEGRDVAGLAFGIGSVYFMEIAKLRASRMLYARVAEAYGRGTETRIHAVTALSNKSIYDPWTNLLRSTTEALSAVLGGADWLHVQPAGYPARLARNIQLILKEEAHMDRVADPAGGSWFIESLTASLAAEAWKLFQQVESMGGYGKARAFIDSAIAAAREAKEKEFASRRRVMVGVNNYPDLGERRLERGRIARRSRVAPGAADREDPPPHRAPCAARREDAESAAAQTRRPENENGPRAVLPEFLRLRRH